MAQKDDHLIDNTHVIYAKDQKFLSWKTNEHLVMLQLINSLTTKKFFDYRSWRKLSIVQNNKREMGTSRATYFSTENTSALLNIETQFNDLCKGYLNVTQYFNLLAPN